MEQWILKAKDIGWDADKEELNCLEDLPVEIEIPLDVIAKSISDYISDLTGFCHKGFTLTAESAKKSKLKHAENLWKDFGNIPMNPDTECIEEEWHGFPVGTHREKIWHWFEEMFDLSVAKDLMGL